MDAAIKKILIISIFQTIFFSYFRGKSMERILNPENEKTRKLQKSKSMEFLKAKLLSRKSSTKSQVQPVQQQQQHNHGPLDPRLFQHVHAPSSPSRQQMYVFLKLLPHYLPQGALWSSDF